MYCLRISLTTDWSHRHYFWDIIPGSMRAWPTFSDAGEYARDVEKNQKSTLPGVRHSSCLRDQPLCGGGGGAPHIHVTPCHSPSNTTSLWEATPLSSQFCDRPTDLSRARLPVCPAHAVLTNLLWDSSIHRTVLGPLFSVFYLQLIINNALQSATDEQGRAEQRPKSITSYLGASTDLC